jgi:hypothetical protein
VVYLPDRRVAPAPELLLRGLRRAISTVPTFTLPRPSLIARAVSILSGELPVGAAAGVAWGSAAFVAASTGLAVASERPSRRTPGSKLARRRFQKDQAGFMYKP